MCFFYFFFFFFFFFFYIRGICIQNRPKMIFKCIILGLNKRFVCPFGLKIGKVGRSIFFSIFNLDVREMHKTTTTTTTKQKQKQTNNNNKTTQVFQNFGSVGKWQTNIFFGGPYLQQISD